MLPKQFKNKSFYAREELQNVVTKQQDSTVPTATAMNALTEYNATRSSNDPKDFDHAREERAFSSTSDDSLKKLFSINKKRKMNIMKIFVQQVQDVPNNETQSLLKKRVEQSIPYRLARYDSGDHTNMVQSAFHLFLDLCHWRDDKFPEMETSFDKTNVIYSCGTATIIY